MEGSGKVGYERSGAAAVLTITRPERRNAVDAETGDELLAGYRRFEADDEARVMVLTGDGPEAFCSGADLKAITEIAEAGTDLAEAGRKLAARSEGPMGFTRLTPTKPTIAAISGWCLAGGLELALWCDLRIATEDARFGCFDRRWGIPLIDGGTVRLPRIVGRGRALEMILTGREVSAQEAHAWGLVNELVAPGEHLTRALEIAEGLARFPQQTMLSDRRSALETEGMETDTALASEAEIGLESLGTAIEGAARFAGGEGRHGEGSGV
ncbi:MAG: crotonase/enoyl-CoA hydratase family protein [Solirubrobacterales bacterium]